MRWDEMKSQKHAVVEQVFLLEASFVFSSGKLANLIRSYYNYFIINCIVFGVGSISFSIICNCLGSPRDLHT